MEEQLINTLFSLVRDMEFLIQLTAMPFLVSFRRCLECRLCTCGAASGTADFPRRLGRRSAGGDHQGAGNADPRTDSRDEPELHRIQVPADQEPSLAKGNKFKCGSSDWRTTGGRRHAFSSFCVGGRISSCRSFYFFFFSNIFIFIRSDDDLVLQLLLERMSFPNMSNDHQRIRVRTKQHLRRRRRLHHRPLSTKNNTKYQNTHVQCLLLILNTIYLQLVGVFGVCGGATTKSSGTPTLWRLLPLLLLLL